jgi:hypothetical protein
MSVVHHHAQDGAREQHSFAGRPPRVVAGLGGMERAAAAIVDRYADQYNGPALRIFDSVPVRHGVIAANYDATILRKGEVAVYDELAVDSEGLIEGQVYVVEYQTPAHSMPWHVFTASPGARMKITRSIVVLKRHENHGDQWWLHPLRVAQAGVFVMSDGPFDSYHLTPKVIGRVVGIYNPAALAGGVQ